MCFLLLPFGMLLPASVMQLPEAMLLARDRAEY